jgi:hypothetical protein
MSDLTDIVFSPNGAFQASPGQRPGKEPHPTSKALKGRPNLCRSLWPASTHTLFSARKTVNPSLPIPCVTHCMPTWLPFCKTFIALPFSSTRWKITSISFSTWLEQLPSVKSSRMSKNPPPNGSKPKERNSSYLPGNQVTEPSLFPNRMSKLSASTLPSNANTTAQNPSKKNTGHSSNATISRMMNGMCGIDSTLGIRDKRTNGAVLRQPRATAKFFSTNGAVLWTPRATAKLFSTNGAALREPRATAKLFSTNGAALREPRATPWEQCPHIHRGPRVRPKCSVPVRAGFQPSMVVRGADLGRCPRLAWGRALPLEKGGWR